MKFLIMMLVAVSCAHKKPIETEETVTVDTAVLQAGASYLKGCVDAFKDLKIPAVFETCRDKAEIHKQEILYIMEQNP